MQGTTDTTLFSSLKSILSSELKTYEKMIMVVLEMYHHEYGDVFPDYETIAADGGMSKRKAQYVVKDLTEKQIISKTHRFKDKPDGTRMQTSNRYCNIGRDDAVQTSNPQESLHAQDAPPLSKFYAQDAPYKAGFINQESFELYPSTDLKNKEEEDYIKRTREIDLKKYARYAQVYQEMVDHQGTGALSYLQMEFLENCVFFNLPPILVKTIYGRVKSEVNKYHFDSIHRTFLKYAERLSRKSIDNPIAWFESTYRNEDIKVRSEIALSMSSQSAS
jgi:hypothetical protein